MCVFVSMCTVCAHAHPCMNAHRHRWVRSPIMVCQTEYETWSLAVRGGGGGYYSHVPHCDPRAGQTRIAIDIGLTSDKEVEYEYSYSG